MAKEEKRQQIEDLITDYVHCIDDDRLEEWPAFFTEDAKYQIISRESFDQGLPVGIMYCESRGMLEDRVFALRRANIYEPHSYRHMISATKILDSSNGEYRVQTNYHVVRIMQEGTVSVFSTGKYLDRIVFEEGRPKFKERLVVFDSRRVDTLLVIPI
ncbi:MAG: aromatic-ring-hydroxylating dioxygenase subunit beta, partial [SAR324 cluster bacterium]|nr:aromatic-ring-hydroxylating dioxygenase subunit beta [SAR324 cluster bacterium]